MQVDAMRPPSGPLWVHEINRGYRAGAYRGYRYGVGAAAMGAAAVGAAAAGAYYRGGCGYDAYGNWVCPRIERRDAVGLCKEPKASCNGAGDGAVVHVDEREV